MNRDLMIQFRSVTHRYGRRVAVDTVDLSVPSGSIFALLGPNGGGKTTLFKILTTLITPSSGSACVAGFDVLVNPNEVRARIGIVFQKPSLDDKLTVRENLMHQGHLYGLSGRTLRSRSGNVLERFGLADRATDLAGTLSGGLQRRVELAKSLLHEPQVLVLDEPSTGLDPGARAGLMEQLCELRDREGVTCLLTTHLMDEADRCDHVAFLDRGKLITHDTPTALKSTIGGDVVTIHTAVPDDLATRAAARFGLSAEVVDGVVHIERSKGHAFVPDLIEAFPGEIDSVTVGRPTLDDVFLHLTGHTLWNGIAASELGGAEE